MPKNLAMYCSQTTFGTFEISYINSISILLFNFVFLSS